MKKALCLALVFLMLSAALPAAASGTTEEKTALQVIIVPKFEIGEMRGDFPGEAQLFYEKQCTGSPETVIPHMPASGHFYVNEETGAAILVTGSGKTAAALSLSAALSSGLYDYSDAYIVSVGCGGGNAAVCVPGDVVVATAACDYDLGHHVDVHEREKRDKLIMWFPDDSFAEYETQRFNPELAEKAYELIRDCPLRTTELARTVMAENFPAPEPSGPEPSVKKGTVISGDNYWKGRYGHTTANYIAEYYGCADPYAVTEMEEIAVANTAECFGLLDRIISLRVIVNMDLFINGETPESVWGEYSGYNAKVTEENDETFDIFEPAMYNLFDTAGMVIDAILDGTIR